jgi:parvulin-like peptidyl-prolyl isomerase
MAIRIAVAVAVALILTLQQGGSPTGDLPAKYRLKAPTGAVARVDGVDITAGDVDPLLWEWRGSEAIQELINYQIVRAEAQKRRVDVSEKDVESTVDAALQQIQKNAQPGSDSVATLASNGMTRSRMYLRLRTQLLLQKMLENEFDPRKLVKVSTIIVRTASEQASAVAEAIKRADDAYARLQKGESWDKVFDSMSAGTTAQGTKGLLLAAFPTTVATELQTLKPGQVSKPAQTGFGIQIFRLEVAGKDAAGKDLEEMKNAYMQAGGPQLIAKLQKDAKIERLYPPSFGH